MRRVEEDDDNKQMALYRRSTGFVLSSRLGKCMFRAFRGIGHFKKS